MTRSALSASAVALALFAACERGPSADDMLRAGRTLLENGHPDRALASFEGAAAETEREAKSPGALWTEAALGAAEALVGLGDFAAAHGRLDEIERLAPASPDLDRRVAALRTRAGLRPPREAPDVIDAERIPLRDMMERAVDFPDDIRPRRER